MDRNRTNNTNNTHQPILPNDPLKKNDYCQKVSKVLKEVSKNENKNKWKAFKSQDQ